MWLAYAFLSAFLLGCYDVNKKLSLNGNAVIPVLFINTLVSSLIFLPFVFLSWGTHCLDGSMLYVPQVDPETHLRVFLKAVIVLSSWMSGYFALKHLPLTITGPIKATQPILTLLGAMLLFGERLNFYQWVGVVLAIASFYLLSSSGKKEGIVFSHNKWIYLTLLSILTGAMSGLYDKHLMRSLDVMTVQVWFNVYQCLMMLPILLFLSVADWVYFYALSDPDSMISIVSMVRRSNVLVTFTAGALFFHEKNLKSKAIDLFLVFLGMIFLYLGSK